MLFGFPVQTFTKIGQSAAELWSKNDYKMAFKEPSLDPYMADGRHIENHFWP